MTLHGINVSQERLAEFCRANKINKLALFGSILHDDFRPESDIDVLVEFLPEARVGFSFIRMQDELTLILGRRVDLHTPATLSKYFREEVLREAKVQYVAA